jgi:valyl-tRNA synthetase
MSSELSKTYDPAAVEAEAYRVWLDEKCFAADPAKAGPAYSIVIPPPNVTGALHLGHAINNTLQDILTRVHRMRGFNTLWVPGIDHAGIATQAVVEKQLKEKENKTRETIGREELVKRIWQWKEQYGDRILAQLKRLGCSCDWDRTRFTLDDMCARAVRETFFKLFKDGLIYRGKRLVNWDVQLQTSISDDEIYHETVKTSLWHIRYPIESTEKFMTVATTRPETMLGDTAVAVHSQDQRWNWAIGKQVRLPLTDRLIPIIADDILVDPKFGTGVVKVTPAHDPNDYAVWQRHQGKPDQIDLINILNPDGKINDAGGKYAGMKRDAARKKVVEDLTALGLLEKEEPYETQVGHSDRSKTAIEPYLSDQWFVKMAPLAEPALEVVRNGTIKFFPERHAQQYLAWLGEKRDWPVSRQLWWGHRITVWTRADLAWDVEKVGRRLSQWEKEDRIAIAPIGDKRATGGEYDSPSAPDSRRSQVVCVRDPEGRDGPIVRFLEENHFIQDPDVLDTWFSSALWPHSTLGWPDETPWLKKYYPTSVLLTGRDIITLWVARMVMTGLYNMKDIPFHHVAINPTILDGKGERMSKSKGNGVDPVEIIDAYGADALRFTLTLMATETQDARLPVKKDAQGRNTSEKFDIGRSFANKLWNAARFALEHLQAVNPEPVDESKWALADRWIVSRFSAAVAEADEALKAYRFDQYAKVCYDFFWRDFCDWYLETAKLSLKDASRAGQTAHVLAAVLDGALRLMHPMIPFVTETIWWKLNEARKDRGLPGRIECPPSTRLILAAWPKVGSVDQPAEATFATIQEIVGAIRNFRNVHQIEQKKILEVGIEPFDPEVANSVAEINLLAGCQLQPGAKDTPRAAVGRFNLFFVETLDKGAEAERVEKHRDELNRKIATLNGRLKNAGYIAKAPPHLVEETKKQLADAEAELAKLS